MYYFLEFHFTFLKRIPTTWSEYQEPTKKQTFSV